MIGWRAALFITGFLGTLYALLSVVNGSDTDIYTGMVLAGLSLIGWAAIDIWEELR